MRNTGSWTTPTDPGRKAPETDTDTQTGEQNKDILVYQILRIVHYKNGQMAHLSTLAIICQEVDILIEWLKLI